MIRRKLGARKRKVDWVVIQNYWEGFMERVARSGVGTRGGALEYASTSGLYDLNEVRKYAHGEGWDYAGEVIEKAGRSRFGVSVEMRVPNEVFMRAYEKAGIVGAPPRRQSLELR